MKIKTKTVTKKYFTTKDYIDFQVFLLKHHQIKQSDFAKRVGISEAYLTLLIHGDRPLTDKMIARFKKAGYDIKEDK